MRAKSMLFNEKSHPMPCHANLETHYSLDNGEKLTQNIIINNLSLNMQKKKIKRTKNTKKAEYRITKAPVRGAININVYIPIQRPLKPPP